MWFYSNSSALEICEMQNAVCLVQMSFGLVSNGFVSFKIYDKRDDFDFYIVNFPFLDGDVPRCTFYGVNISQLFGLLECLVNWLISMPVIYV